MRSVTVDDQGDGETLVDYTPGGPEAGQRPGAARCDDFLTAMTATPLNTSVARQFLTSESSSSWVPERGTLVYGSHRLVSPPAAARSRLQLRDVVELDGRGTWLGDPTAGGARLHAAPGQGGRRVADQPPARPADHPAVALRDAVPAVLPLLLRQVRPGAGPRAGLRAARRAGAHPARRRPARGPRGRTCAGWSARSCPAAPPLDDISVPVSRDGTAEVPLSDEVLDVDDDQLRLLFAQIGLDARPDRRRGADAGHRGRHPASTCRAPAWT